MTTSGEDGGRPIRLAFLLGQLTRGGAELQMLALTEHLTGNGFEVDFVTRSGDGPLDRAARDAGARVRHLGRASSAATPLLRRSVRLMARNGRWITTARRRRYDIVDAWLHPADSLAALTRPLTRVPVVMSARLGRSPRMGAGAAGRLLDAAVFRLTDAVVANARITAEDARRQGVPADKVRLVRGGVRPAPVFSPAQRHSHRAALGVEADDFLIGCVGNFRAMKRQDLLVAAYARLLPEHPRARLVLVGDGELRPQLEGQLRTLGLADRVILFGTATDLAPLYDAFDLFVQASNSEGLPNVLLEASSAGLPIVATDAGGTHEVIEDGRTGLLVPIDDEEALTGAMHRAMGDPELRQRLGTAARDLIATEYGMDRFFREYRELYRALLATRGHP
jgi:glycosyltransferase involved in cell wall biosynthesis